MASSPEQLVRNQVLLREVNERIPEIATCAAGEPPEFLCECSRKDCTKTLVLSLRDCERVHSSPNLFVILPGHDCAEVGRVVETRHDSHLVEKTKHLELVFSRDRITLPEGS